MSIKIATLTKTTLALIGTVGLNVGILAPTAAGAVAGAVTYHMANPTPVRCDGSCAPNPGWICGLNGINYFDHQYE